MAFLLTQICRTRDGLELTEQSSATLDLTEFRRQARTLVDRVRVQRGAYGEKNKTHVDSDLGPYYYLFVTSGALLLMTLCERKYPKKLALIYLEELEREFTTSYSSAQIDAATTPFVFQSFETFMLKTKRLYEDSSSQRNVDQMAKVQSELTDVHRVLSQNIHDMVERGAKIANVSQKTDELFTESLKYEKQAKHINLLQLWRTYGMYASVVALVTLVLYFRFKWY